MENGYGATVASVLANEPSRCSQVSTDDEVYQTQSRDVTVESDAGVDSRLATAEAQSEDPFASCHINQGSHVPIAAGDEVNPIVDQEPDDALSSDHATQNARDSSAQAGIAVFHSSLVALDTPTPDVEAGKVEAVHDGEAQHTAPPPTTEVAAQAADHKITKTATHATSPSQPALQMDGARKQGEGIQLSQLALTPDQRHVARAMVRSLVEPWEKLHRASGALGTSAKFIPGFEQILMFSFVSSPTPTNGEIADAVIRTMLKLWEQHVVVKFFEKTCKLSHEALSLSESIKLKVLKEARLEDDVELLHGIRIAVERAVDELVRDILGPEESDRSGEEDEASSSLHTSAHLVEQPTMSAPNVEGVREGVRELRIYDGAPPRVPAGSVLPKTSRRNPSRLSRRSPSSRNMTHDENSQPSEEKLSPRKHLLDESPSPPSTSSSKTCSPTTPVLGPPLDPSNLSPSPSPSKRRRKS